MKKIIALLLALLMIAGMALAEDAVSYEDNATLSLEEIQMFLDQLGKEAAAAPDVPVDVQDDGITAYYSAAELTIADEQMTPSTAVLAARLRPDREDLRGISLGDTVEDVMAVYPNDNPELYGTYYEAPLYVSGGEPEAAAGFILRDGQRITSIVHYAYVWDEEGVIRASVAYEIEQGTVVGISIRGEAERIEAAEALEQIDDIAAMQEVREYFAYPASADGASLLPFDREDLTFGGLDFLDLSPEMAESVLGASPVDEWTEDSTGEFLRLKQWDGVSVLFLYDAQKNFVKVDSMTIDDDVIEGPRGVRIGDMMDGVMNRFRHGENAALESGVALYGDGVNPPYCVLAYGEETATLSYAFSLEDGRQVNWHLTFIDGELMTQIFLLR